MDLRRSWNPGRHVTAERLSDVTVKPHLRFPDPRDRRPATVTEEQELPSLAAGQALNNHLCLRVQRDHLRPTGLVLNRRYLRTLTRRVQAVPSSIDPLSARVSGEQDQAVPRPPRVTPLTRRRPAVAVPASAVLDLAIAVCPGSLHRQTGPRDAGPPQPQTEICAGPLADFSGRPRATMRPALNPIAIAHSDLEGDANFLQQAPEATRTMDTIERVAHARPACGRSCFSASVPARRPFRRRCSATQRSIRSVTVGVLDCSFSCFPRSLASTPLAPDA